ncbi:MAG: hypothetical protein GX316_05395 [Firmicutes bacterium]|nr:hypothetical protein [Bacillota bacterium]
MRGVLTRQDRALSQAEAVKIIQSADYGVLATVDAIGRPCTAALNHVLINDNKIVFHGSLQGEKIENIKLNPHVSFFVVGEAEVIPKEFSTTYTSAVAHGKAALVEDTAKKRRYLDAFVARFVSDSVSKDSRISYIEQGFPSVAVIEMTVEHLTGKARV